MKPGWLVPSLIMTLGLMTVAAALMRFAAYDGSNLLSVFGLWVMACLAAGMVLVLVETVKLMRVGEPRPLSTIARKFGARYWIIALGGPMLAGLNMTTFMWIKPEINAIAPFRYDALFASMDHVLFGADPWTLFSWINLDLMARTYNQLWLAALAAAVFVIFNRPASIGRDRLIITYFLMWSVFGPVGQALFPAAGPIFYERIGLGDRFAPLTADLPTLTRSLSGYLWRHYEARDLAAGAGISAMPSLHIATATWMSMVCWKTRLFWPSVLFALYMVVGSVVLGWHYVVDGIAGALGALLCFAVARPLIVGKSQRNSPGEAVQPSSAA